MPKLSPDAVEGICFVLKHTKTITDAATELKVTRQTLRTYMNEYIDEVCDYRPKGKVIEVKPAPTANAEPAEV